MKRTITMTNKYRIHQELMLPRKRGYSTHTGGNPFEPEDPFWKTILIMVGVTLPLWFIPRKR